MGKAQEYFHIQYTIALGTKQFNEGTLSTLPKYYVQSPAEKKCLVMIKNGAGETKDLRMVSTGF
jgi:hypothetical protein